jgi:membrane-associated phospholipid phosphatase
MAARVSDLLLRLHPADRIVLALLVLAVGVAGLRLPSVREPLVGLFVLHLVLLAAFASAVVVLVRWERRGWVQFVRPAAIVMVIFTLYATLGRLGVEAMPYLADGFLSRLDTALFGFDPSLALEPYLTYGRVEFFSFVYSAFIPYINVTIILSCLGLPPLRRDQFLTGWVLTYAISYLGYIFVPAQGPVLYHAADYESALSGGFFYEVVVRGVEASGGLQGAFPSLHVGGSLYLCLFELRANRLRGLIYLPLIILIYAATLVLRYHYVVDLIAGTLIAAVCLSLGQRWFTAWARCRQDAGLPALPGGEGDALPPLSPVGAGDPSPVLQAD